MSSTPADLTASLQKVWMDGYNRWCEANCKIGQRPPAAFVLTAMVQMIATMVSGAPTKDDRAQLASDVLEVFDMFSKVSAVDIMKYRLKHRPGAQAATPPQGSA